MRGYVEGRVSPPVTSECRFLVYDASILPKKEILSSPLPDGRAPKGPLQFTYLVGGLMVEHLKVMAALTVEPAFASLTVEPAFASLSVEPCRTSPFWSSTSPLLISRAP